MEVTYTVIVFIITYIFGAFTKAFIDAIPNKYIPLQNVAIGIISGLICYYVGIESSLLQSMVLCFMASIGAGGTADLVKVGEKDDF